MNALRFILPLFLVPAGPAAAEPTVESVRAELSSPVRLKIGTDNTVSGKIARVYDRNVVIRTAVAGGEITQTFHFDQIDAVTFPGDAYHGVAAEWLDSGRTGDAIAVLDMLLRQRTSLLELLPAAEAHRFVRLAEAELEAGMPARALAVAETIGPHVEAPAAKSALEATVLEATFALKFDAEARALADRWLETRDAYGGSALGYAVRATIDYRDGRHPDALDTALEAVVLSGNGETRHLGACYAVAIAAAWELRERDLARRLYRETAERGLTLPPVEGVTLDTESLTDPQP